MSLAKNVEFLRRLPKLNGFNGFGRWTLKPGQRSPLVETNDFGTNPGELRMFSFVPDNLQPAPGSCRRPAWLRPDRGRLRSRRRLVDAREALRFRVADAGAAAIQQSRNGCFNWFNPEDTARDQRRSLLDPADDRADGRAIIGIDRIASSSPGFPPAAR